MLYYPACAVRFCFWTFASTSPSSTTHKIHPDPIPIPNIQRRFPQLRSLDLEIQTNSEGWWGNKFLGLELLGGQGCRCLWYIYMYKVPDGAVLGAVPRAMYMQAQTQTTRYTQPHNCSVSSSRMRLTRASWLVHVPLRIPEASVPATRPARATHGRVVYSIPRILAILEPRSVACPEQLSCLAARPWRIPGKLPAH